MKGAASGVTMSLVAHGASMDDLIRAIRGFAGAPLVNETRLDGVYDFKLTWESGQSLSGPLQGQLGLRLESRKVPVDYFIIESAEKPAPN